MPIGIESMRYTAANRKDVAKWCGDFAYNRCDCLSIDTLNGRKSANYGDWVIKGIKGDFYPCTNDIFMATYPEKFMNKYSLTPDALLLELYQLYDITKVEIHEYISGSTDESPLCVSGHTKLSLSLYGRPVKKEISALRDTMLKYIEVRCVAGDRAVARLRGEFYKEVKDWVEFEEKKYNNVCSCCNKT